jgi:Ni,Fe-hydrogenase I cytochrome b subunit
LLLLCYIKGKQQHGKNQNKNTGLFINCMDFVVVHTKINKKINRHIFRMLGPWVFDIFFLEKLYFLLEFDVFLSDV